MIKYYVAGDYAPEVGTSGAAGLDLFVDNINAML